jgi:hypothetical protein
MELLASLGLAGSILNNNAVPSHFVKPPPKNNVFNANNVISTPKNIYNNANLFHTYQEIDKKAQKQYEISKRIPTNTISPISQICSKPNKIMTGNNIELMTGIGNYNPMNNNDNDSEFSDDYAIPSVGQRSNPPSVGGQRKSIMKRNFNDSPSLNSEDNNNPALRHHNKNVTFNSDILSEDGLYRQQQIQKKLKQKINANANQPCKDGFLEQFAPLAFDFEASIPNTYNNTSSTYKVTNGQTVDASTFNKNDDGRYGVTGDMTHNNMMPHPTSKTYGFNPERDKKYSNVMNQKVDLFTGSDQALQYRHKSEVNYMFAPSTGYVESVTGVPNFSNFFQSRVPVSTIRNGERPFEPVKTSPGLNLSYYGTSPYVRQDMFRPTPKTVDELRVLTNPKVSWTAPVGPAGKGERGPMIGAVNKKGPDSFFWIDPSSVAPNQGNYEGNRLTGKFALNPTSRQQTAETNHLNPISNREGATPEYMRGQFATPFKNSRETDGPRGANRETMGVVMSNYKNNVPDNTQRETQQGYVGTTQGNFTAVPLDNYMNAIPDTTLREITGGQTNLGAISNKVNGYLFNKINAIPDETARAIIGGNVRLAQFNGNHGNGSMFNYENGIADTTMRETTENTIYVKPISNKELGYLIDYSNATPDPTLRNIVNAFWGSSGKGFTGNKQQQMLFDFKNAIPDETLRSVISQVVRLGTIDGNKTAGYLMNYINTIPDATLREFTENNQYLVGFQGNQIKQYLFDYLSAVPDTTIREITGGQRNMVGFQGNSEALPAFNYKNGVPDITMRNTTEEQKNIIGFQGNHEQMRSHSDVSNALINSNREVVLTRRHGENGVHQTQGKTAFFTEYEFNDDRAKKVPVYGGQRIAGSIKNELYFG